MEDTQMTDNCDNRGCTQLSRIVRLEARGDNVVAVIEKLDEKLDRILVQLSRVEVMEHKHLSHSDALGRAFERIELIEKQSSETAKVLNDLTSQIRGMTRLAILLWSVLGGAVTVTVVKLFGGA